MRRENQPCPHCGHRSSPTYPPEAATVLESASRLSGVPVAVIASRDKTSGPARARAAVATVLRQNMGWRYAEIERLFCGISQGSARKQVERCMDSEKYDPQLWRLLEGIKESISVGGV